MRQKVIILASLLLFLSCRGPESEIKVVPPISQSDDSANGEKTKGDGPEKVGDSKDKVEDGSEHSPETDSETTTDEVAGIAPVAITILKVEVRDQHVLSITFSPVENDSASSYEVFISADKDLADASIKSLDTYSFEKMSSSPLHIPLGETYQGTYYVFIETKLLQKTVRSNVYEVLVKRPDPTPKPIPKPIPKPLPANKVPGRPTGLAVIATTEGDNLRVDLSWNPAKDEDHGTKDLSYQVFMGADKGNVHRTAAMASVSASNTPKVHYIFSIHKNKLQKPQYAMVRAKDPAGAVGGFSSVVEISKPVSLEPATSEILFHETRDQWRGKNFEVAVTLFPPSYLFALDMNHPTTLSQILPAGFDIQPLLQDIEGVKPSAAYDMGGQKDLFGFFFVMSSGIYKARKKVNNRSVGQGLVIQSTTQGQPSTMLSWDIDKEFRTGALIRVPWNGAPSLYRIQPSAKDNTYFNTKNDPNGKPQQLCIIESGRQKCCPVSQCGSMGRLFIQSNITLVEKFFADTDNKGDQNDRIRSSLIVTADDQLGIIMTYDNLNGSGMKLQEFGYYLEHFNKFGIDVKHAIHLDGGPTPGEVLDGHKYPTGMTVYAPEGDPYIPIARSEDKMPQIFYITDPNNLPTAAQ